MLFYGRKKKNEGIFLSRFYETVKYRRNDNWSYDNEKAQMLHYELYLKSVRYNEQYSLTMERNLECIYYIWMEI